jgi:hypothetical protein
MADSGASSSAKNPSNTKRRCRSDARKVYDKKRDASRIFLLDAFERWRAFKQEHNLKTDQNVADFLLDHYALRNTLW